MRANTGEYLFSFWWAEQAPPPAYAKRKAEARAAQNLGDGLAESYVDINLTKPVI